MDSKTETVSDNDGYVNKEIKKVSKEHLKKVLHDLHVKHQEERRQHQIDLNNALRDGFRCVPNPYK